MLVADELRVVISTGETMLIDRADWEQPRMFYGRDGFQASITIGDRRWRYEGDRRSGFYVKAQMMHEKRVRKLLLHRVVMEAQRGQLVDHIHGNTLDNRRSGLRFVTAKENSRNQKPSGLGSSVFKGVHWSHKRNAWVASIGMNGERIKIGVFATEQEAALAYDAKAQELFGEFARLNLPGSALATQESQFQEPSESGIAFQRFGQARPHTVVELK